MWVLDDENGKRALLESGLGAFHVKLSVPSLALKLGVELLISFTCQCHSSALIVKYYT